MFEIGHGIEVYYENKKEVRNTVFFPDNTYIYYGTGGMLFEVIGDEATFMITEKVGNMIKAYPGYQDSLTAESITDGFKWLHESIEDDDLPVATWLFRSAFSDIIHSALEKEELVTGCDCVGTFFRACFEEYLDSIKTFAVLFDALAADASGTPDDFQKEAADAFRGFADEMYDVYVKKCSVRHINGSVSVETHEITNLLQLLTFEFCRLKKEGKAVKICANCGRYFIPPHRIDSKYCSLTAPQDPSKTCNEIGPQVQRAEKRKTDPREREHHNARSKLHMAAKRARDNGEDNLLPWYKSQLDKEMGKYKTDKE